MDQGGGYAVGDFVIGPRIMILLIDNYDSFVHNLARYLRRLGQDTHVVRNDQITVAEIASIAPSPPCLDDHSPCIHFRRWSDSSALAVAVGTSCFLSSPP